MKTLSTISLTLAVAALITGCAVTQEDLNAVRAEAQQAQTAANNAQTTADQALRTARDAQTCCSANEEKFDRLFQRSMMK